MIDKKITKLKKTFDKNGFVIIKNFFPRQKQKN